jgi:hypothetical protein
VEKTLSAGELCGYPIFATCPDVTALEDLNYPLFLLGDSGLPLQGLLDCQAVGQIANLSHRIISSLVLYLLREPVQAQALIEKQKASSLSKLALEGKSIIEATCGLEKFDLMEPDMPLLQTLLSQIPPTQAQEHFRYDMHAGVICIRCRLLREVTRKPLYEELLAKNPSVRLQGDHYIACPAAWFLDLLAKFYGRPITLPHQPTDPTQPAEAQS